MDPSTYEVRLSHWMAVVENCQARPESQSAKQWLSEHGIPEKKYYYWLRRIRKAALSGMQQALPAVQDTGQTVAAAPPALIEIPASEVLPEAAAPAITIWTRKSTIEISSSVPSAELVKLLKAVSHAL